MTKKTNTRFQLGEIGLPDLPLLMLITLDALRALGGSATIQELVDFVIENESISEEQQSYLMPNKRDRRLNYYLSWARTYLKRGEAIDNSSRAVWALTDIGESIMAIDGVKKIYAAVNEEERQRAKLKRDEKKAVKPSPKRVCGPPHFRKCFFR